MNNNRNAKDFVVKNIEKDIADFGISELELRSRITVKLDIEQFNYKEDESVWKQKKEKTYKVAEVYFDDVWCCDMDERDIATSLNLKFFRGFLRGYESGKIRLNRFLASLEDEKQAQIVKDKKDEEKRKIDSLPQSTPEEKAAKEIIKEIVKEDNEKPLNSTTAT